MAKFPDEPAPKKAPKEANLRPAWKKGQSGNPAGRKKGSRNKLAEAFLADMLEDWEANGSDAIKVVRRKKPDAYLKVVASILPKQMDVNVNNFEELTDEQLREQLERVARDLGSLAAFGIAGDADGSEAETRH